MDESKTLPETIENGQGERIDFLRYEPEHPEGPTIWLQNEVQPGSGPPMHVHFQQEESLTVREGRLGYQFEGEEVRYADVGETVVFGKGRPHKFWAEGDQVLRCDGYCRPAHNVQYFLGELYRSTKDSGKGRPGDVDSALLLARYRHEYDMLEIPGFVRTMLFPVLRTIGKLNGRARHYEQGPAPLPGHD